MSSAVWLSAPSDLGKAVGTKGVKSGSNRDLAIPRTRQGATGIKQQKANALKGGKGFYGGHRRWTRPRRKSSELCESTVNVASLLPRRTDSETRRQRETDPYFAVH